MLQWGAPSGVYYPSGEEQGAAKRALDQSGEFRDGIYFPKSGNPKDGFEALLEQITGEPVVYAKPRYDMPIRMRTDAFATIPETSDHRIGVRHLARFNECGPDIRMLSLEAGSAIISESAPADRLYVLLNGSVSCRDERLDEVALMHVARGSSNLPLVSLDACTVLLVTFG